MWRIRTAAGAVLLLMVGIVGATADAVPTKAAPGHVSSTTRPFPAGARFDYQIGGAYRPPRGVTIVDRDRHDAPARGHYNICYVNAFQAQPDELGWWRRHHPRLLLRDATGRLVIDHDWHEVLLDLSTPVKRAGVAAVVGGWIDGCARRGFDAVEPDNLDSWTRSQHLLSQADAIAFAALLSRRGHDDGLLVGQKNASELAGVRARTGFDFAIAEECQVYGECAAYTRAYGRRVIEIEYTDNGRAVFDRACAARGASSSIEYLDRDVVPAGTPGHVRAWCR